MLTCVHGQIEPALLVGNMNDPFWDLPEAIAGASLSSPFPFPTSSPLRDPTLALHRPETAETWSVDKCLSDARRLVARCGEQPPLLHAMFIIQQLFRYVSKHTHAHHCHFPHPSLFMRVCV